MEEVRVAIILLFLFVGNLIYSQENVNLRAEISGLRNNRGNVRIAIFNSRDGFPDNPDKALLVKIIPVKNNVVIVTFDAILMGTYAIGVIHDENGNNKMDTNWLGVPMEGYAVSNNIIGKYGPPDFDDAKINLTHTMSIEINMVY